MPIISVFHVLMMQIIYFVVACNCSVIIVLMVTIICFVVACNSCVGSHDDENNLVRWLVILVLHMLMMRIIW
jgi:hypothetical protein